MNKKRRMWQCLTKVQMLWYGNQEALELLESKNLNHTGTWPFYFKLRIAHYNLLFELSQMVVTTLQSVLTFFLYICNLK